MIAPEQLAAWRKLADEATAGEWEVGTHILPLTEVGTMQGCRPDSEAFRENWVQTSWVHGQLHDKQEIITRATSPYCLPSTFIHIDNENAAFIAASRTAVPALLDEVDRLRARVAELEAATATAEAEAGRLREALTRIKRWFGEFPESNTTWDDGTKMTYGQAFGSNGEREYMRSIAREALAASAPETKQGEREQLAEALLQWAANPEKVLYIGDDGIWHCHFCDCDESLNIDPNYEGADKANEVKMPHADSCLHLRAKALRAQAGGEG